MSVHVTEQWFSSKIRRNRKSFMGANAVLFLIIGIVFLALWFFDVRRNLSAIIFLMFFLPFIVVYYFLAAQRLRDMNITGWLALIQIPINFFPDQISSVISFIFLFVLCVVPGTVGKNRYGSDPLTTN